ncbi:hypothetical protein ACFLS5_04390 [Candidatus Bipolaricaulota bacterium]
MNRNVRSTATALVLFMLIISGYGQFAEAIDVRELAPIAESFRQLAFWDAIAAGDVWMAEEAAATWARFISTALPDQAAAVSLFAHCVLVGELTTDGTPIAGLVNPWTGTLIVLAFSGNAATVEAVAIESVTGTLTETADANQAALAIMEAIGLASDRLDDYLTQPWPSLATEDDWQSIADRLVARSAQLRLVYPAEDITDPVLTLAQETIGLIQSGELTDMLSVLENADPLWIQSLLPIYAATTDYGIISILGSSVEPLDLVWMKISNEGLQEISWIRLFDRVITRTGGES